MKKYGSETKKLKSTSEDKERQKTGTQRTEEDGKAGTGEDELVSRTRSMWSVKRLRGT